MIDRQVESIFNPTRGFMKDTRLMEHPFEEWTREGFEFYRNQAYECEKEIIKLREALSQIASCESRSSGDVVDIARKALA
jgi:hypothetical protein